MADIAVAEQLQPSQIQPSQSSQPPKSNRTWIIGGAVLFVIIAVAVVLVILFIPKKEEAVVPPIVFPLLIFTKADFQRMMFMRGTGAQENRRIGGTVDERYVVEAGVDMVASRADPIPAGYTGMVDSGQPYSYEFVNAAPRAQRFMSALYHDTQLDPSNWLVVDPWDTSKMWSYNAGKWLYIDSDAALVAKIIPLIDSQKRVYARFTAGTLLVTPDEERWTRHIKLVGYAGAYQMREFRGNYEALVHRDAKLAANAAAYIAPLYTEISTDAKSMYSWSKVSAAPFPDNLKSAIFFQTWHHFGCAVILDPIDTTFAFSWDGSAWTRVPTPAGEEMTRNKANVERVKAMFN